MASLRTFINPHFSHQVEVSKNKIPFLVTHDGRTIRYPDPLIKVGPPPWLSDGRMRDLCELGLETMTCSRVTLTCVHHAHCREVIC